MNQSEVERLLAAFPDLLTVSEVATLLRVHPRSVQRWAQQGRFAVVRAGRIYRIPRTDVLRWMLGQDELAREPPKSSEAVAEHI